MLKQQDIRYAKELNLIYIHTIYEKVKLDHSSKNAPKAIKLQEENISVVLIQIFLTPKTQTYSKKMKSNQLHRNYNIHFWKSMVNKMKRHYRMLRKYLQIMQMMKDLYPEKIKYSQNSGS